MGTRGVGERAAALLARLHVQTLRSGRNRISHGLATGFALEAHASASEFDKTWNVFGPLIDNDYGRTRSIGGCRESLNTTQTGRHHRSETFHFVGYSPNPNATMPIPETPDRILKGRAQYQAMWQRHRHPEAAKGNPE